VTLRVQGGACWPLRAESRGRTGSSRFPDPPPPFATLLSCVASSAWRPSLSAPHRRELARVLRGAAAAEVLYPRLRSRRRRRAKRMTVGYCNCDSSICIGAERRRGGFPLRRKPAFIKLSMKLVCV
jgi:hypothetical protein